jgi:hypothetical protein
MTKSRTPQGILTWQRYGFQKAESEQYTFPWIALTSFRFQHQLSLATIPFFIIKFRMRLVSDYLWPIPISPKLITNYPWPVPVSSLLTPGYPWPFRMIPRPIADNSLVHSRFLASHPRRSLNIPPLLPPPTKMHSRQALAHSRLTSARS